MYLVSGTLSAPHYISHLGDFILAIPAMKRVHTGILLLLYLIAVPVLAVTIAGQNPAPLVVKPDLMVFSRCKDHLSAFISEQVVTEAYRRLEIKTEFVQLPCRRSIMMANAGSYDGEVGRVLNTAADFKNLIAMDSPIMEVEGVAFSKTKDLDVTGWADLEGLRVGIVSGELFAENGGSHLQPLRASTYQQLLTLLIFDRIDVGVGLRKDFTVALADFPEEKDQIQIVGQPLFGTTVSHLVHKKHQELIPRINKIFDTMWENGDTARINEKTVQKLVNKNSGDD